MRVSEDGGNVLRIRPRFAARQVDDEAAIILDVVAAARGYQVAQLLHPERCSRPIAETRQVAMYLIHTLLARNYLDTGRVFGRDRTTVSHACAHIEDLRDDRRFDDEICRMEAQIDAAKDGEQPRAAG